MIKLALLRFISRVCLNITNSQMKKIEVEQLISKGSNENVLSKNMNNEFAKFSNFREYMLDSTKIKSTNTAFVEYMAYRLKDLGAKGEKYFNVLQEEAEKIGITVEEAIVKEHLEIAKTTDFIGRSILAYKQLGGINFREIFEKVNKIDEALLDDFTNEYKKCDYKTKSRYRSYIIKLAKKFNLSEVYVAKKAVECSKKYKKHVGFFLISDEKFLLNKELKKPYIASIIFTKLMNTIKPALYVCGILLLSLMLTLVVSYYYINFDNIILNLIAVLVIFSFSMEIFQKTIDYVLGRIIAPKILPRFDFAKTVDSNSPTYVLIPTIIGSIKKIDEMIEKMEVTYLANRSNNMYYMLLGDCTSTDKEVIDLDDKIIKHAKLKLDELNAKYPENTHLFNFIYRKRIYCEAESCYMGWERKRGAIIEFNRLIVGSTTLQDAKKTLYITYDDIVKAKYAITIDEDTQVSLNTAKDLVSIIAHPLNQPVLSKNGKIVESGYGLIQPSIGLELETVNKSIFSKTFGGFGGLDIYTNAVSNVYQDTFGEAMFCGKGIYNIELFEKLLTDEIPQNLVLSHDLLEGSYLRVGLASDIEVQEGFPNNYIAYMKRYHRWHRGDIQIIRWLFSPKSKLKLLSKWKIFNNLRRPLLDVAALVAICVSAFISNTVFVTTTLTTFVALNFSYILSYIGRIIFGKIKYDKESQYIPIIHGIDADFLNMCFNFVTMPYRAFMCVKAFTTSLYRMVISKKKLLQWTTGETIEKNAKSNLSYYFANMMINLVIGVGLLIIPSSTSLVNIIDFKVFIAIFFLVAPFFAYLLGKDHLIGRHVKLEKEQNNEILEIAKRTWIFFDSLMTPINNYLPTDNYQENRRYKIVNRTSSTNIGLGLLAIINAYDMSFITKEVAVEKLSNIFYTLKKLEKFNGHLYNWYNLKTLEPLRPRFVSTVDSGNFLACIYVVKQFLIEIKDSEFEKNEEIEYSKIVIDMLYEAIDLIDNTNFAVLYDTSRNLFSIGYEVESGKLVDSYYDMLMSENRITSLIAIASRQVTSKHWFALARNMVSADSYKGLISWSGTSFEYFMPYIFNKSYEHTLIDQSLFFTKYSQIKYSKGFGIPWGVSECAYAVKDSELNYQYQAFGIPWLGLKRGLNDYLVISPYASILMLEFDPQKVYKNIKKLKKIGLYSSYGFYESIDYTKEHLGIGEHCQIAKTYMAHHQGMILASINNYLNDGIIKKRFHENPDIKACELLLKERERMKAKIKRSIQAPENVFKQKDVDKYTIFVDCVNSDIEYPQYINTDTSIALLKGSSLSATVTSNGASYIKYKNKIVNKQRYTDVSSSGNYVFLTDKTNGYQILTTDTDINSKNNKNTDKTSWNACLNKVESYIEFGDLETTTTSFLSSEYNMDIRKISIYNNSNIKREILINTYLEPAMTDYMTNVVHPTFSNLQIETYFDSQLDTLVASKRKKAEDDSELYIYAKLVGIDLEKQIETEKQKLVKNGFDAYDSNISKYPLWPVLSYRATIILDPYERQEFYYVVGITDSKYKISNAIVNLDTRSIEDYYKLSGQLNSVIARYLKLEPGRAKVYNNILQEVLFTKPQIKEDKYWDEKLTQNMLWKYSISGDLPIVLIYINKIEDAGIINEVIEFMDYVKDRRIDIDIVVLINEEEPKYGPIYTYVKTRIDRAVYMEYTKGNIYLLNVETLDKAEVKLLSFLSRKYIQNINEFLVVDKSDNINSEKLIEELENAEVDIDE
ncbi:MAG: glucoamylase family protein [Clostridia bacterium]